MALFLRLTFLGVGRTAPFQRDLDLRGFGRFGPRFAVGASRRRTTVGFATWSKIAGLSHVGTTTHQAARCGALGTSLLERKMSLA